MSNDKPVDPKPKGLHEDRSELWYIATGIVNSHETGDDLKQMALGIREQLRLEARVNELTDLFYQVKAERDKFIHDAASRKKYEETYAELASVGRREHPPEGTPDGLRTIVSMIEQYAIPEMPANEKGQVTFFRAVFDAVVLECNAAIAQWEIEKETMYRELAAAKQNIAQWVQLAKYQQQFFAINHPAGRDAGPCPTDAAIAASEKMIGYQVAYPSVK